MPDERSRVEVDWDRQAAEGGPYSRPSLDLQREDVHALLSGARPPVESAVYPVELLASVAGEPVLCLASGGGQQSAFFGLAGARVTVLDLSAGQLEADRRAAAHHGYPVQLVKGDMRDLSAFPGGAFSLVYQPVSACFVPELRTLYHEVYRVVRPGGRYKVAHCNPATYATSFVGGDCGWDGFGYRIAEPFGGGPIRRDASGRENLREGTPTGEHVHLLADIFGELVAAGFRVEQVMEDPRHLRGAGDSVPGSEEHYVRTVAQYFAIVARRPE
jgi:SAM-dependent methyltransferase